MKQVKIVDKSHIHTITCDSCDRKLGFSESITDYYLSLTCHTCENLTGASLDLYMCPPIDQQKHFCGLGCLRNWLDENN